MMQDSISESDLNDSLARLRWERALINRALGALIRYQELSQGLAAGTRPAHKADCRPQRRRQAILEIETCL